MSRKSALLATSATLVVVLGAGVAWRLAENDGGAGERGERGPAAVRVADIERGPIEERRVFTGTLEASARFTVAAQRAGRIESLAVDLADPVERGQTVARLDDGEARQDLLQAEAQVAVARAQQMEAVSTQNIAERSATRLETLHEQGVTSDTQLDTGRAELLSARAAVAVAEADVTRAQAGVRTAEIRLQETEARAVWTLEEGEPDGPRIVAERYVSEGDSVSTHTPLFSVVDLDPVIAVIFVTERDYGRIVSGQPAVLDVDAWPGRTFAGRVARVSPVFDAGSRQARVEVAVPNADAALKPGMFARVGVSLQQIDDAITVPADALTRRDGKPSVFLLSTDGQTVHQRAVRTGITAGDRVQLLSGGPQAPPDAVDDPPLSGRVVTLGQQLLNEGSAVNVVEQGRPPAADAATPAESGGAGNDGAARP